jgi:putative ABC transport system permease protein
MALGARAADVLRLLLGEGLRITAVGTGLGLIGALAIGRVINTLLYGTTTGDGAVFAASALGVGVVSLASTFLPARRAAHWDPSVTLRAE